MMFAPILVALPHIEAETEVWIGLFAPARTAGWGGVMGKR
jgi:hypothetical protein